MCDFCQGQQLVSVTARINCHSKKFPQNEKFGTTKYVFTEKNIIFLEIGTFRIIRHRKTPENIQTLQGRRSQATSEMMAPHLLHDPSHAITSTYFWCSKILGCRSSAKELLMCPG